MKAIRVKQFGGPEVLRLETVDVPTPEKGQVLVRVKACGVNPYETYMRSGRYDRQPPLPYTPGGDCAGIVEGTGAGVSTFKKGDRVYTSGSLIGTYAEYTVCDETQLHPLPDNVSFSQGACLGVPYGTAYAALFRIARAEPSEMVLVHGGSGGVGIAGIQLAKAAGMTVIATAGSERGKRLVTEQGADHVLDHADQGRFKRIMSITENGGVDVVLEMLANSNLEGDLTVLAHCGRVVVIGSRGRVEIDPRQLMGSGSSITGMLMFNTPARELKIIHAGIIAGLSNKTLNPVVGKELPLADAAVAHTQIMESGAYGKIVLVP